MCLKQKKETIIKPFSTFRILNRFLLSLKSGITLIALDNLINLQTMLRVLHDVQKEQIWEQSVIESFRMNNVKIMLCRPTLSVQRPSQNGCHTCCRGRASRQCELARGSPTRRKQTHNSRSQLGFLELHSCLWRN